MKKFRLFVFALLIALVLTAIPAFAQDTAPQPLAESDTYKLVALQVGEAWNIVLQSASGQAAIVLQTNTNEVLAVYLDNDSFGVTTRKAIVVGVPVTVLNNGRAFPTPLSLIRATVVVEGGVFEGICAVHWLSGELNGQQMHSPQIFRAATANGALNCSEYITITGDDFAAGAHFFYEADNAVYVEVDSSACWIKLQDIPADQVILSGGRQLRNPDSADAGSNPEVDENELYRLVDSQQGLVGLLFTTGDQAEPNAGQDELLCNLNGTARDRTGANQNTILLGPEKDS